MKIKDPKVMATPRSTCCEYCRKNCTRTTERHHIQPRGLGGGNRLDIPENLVDLGGDFDCRCHQDAQAGVITKIELFRVAGRRLGTSGIKCRNKVARLLRARKL